MSNALAIAAVTAVLKDLLHNGVIDHDLVATVGDVTVTALPPDRIPIEGPDARSQLNIFLYQVTPNQGWRNAGLPSRDGRGDRVTNAPLALDLHYLVTAYGIRDLHIDILLGYAMQLLHEMSVLTRAAIRTALSPSPISDAELPPALEALATSELAEQVEQIKITPQSLSTEEIMKLWAAFQARYRPTAAYLASVVLIERRHSTKAALPVRERRLLVMPLSRPLIESVSPQYIPAGGQLIIEGQNLRGQVTKVNFGALAADPNVITDRRIAVTAPAGLFAGVNTMQVAHLLDFGTSQEPHRGADSNLAAFILAPSITTSTPITAARGTMLSLSIAPPVGRAQRVVLIIGDRTIAIPARPASDSPAATLDFPIPADFPAGTFLLRVQVDGAESPLGFNAATGFMTRRRRRSLETRLSSHDDDCDQQLARSKSTLPRRSAGSRARCIGASRRAREW